MLGILRVASGTTSSVADPGFPRGCQPLILVAKPIYYLARFLLKTA